MCSSLKTAVSAMNTSQPASMLAAQEKRGARRAYTTTKAISDTSPSSVPAAALAAKSRPWASA